MAQGNVFDHLLPGAPQATQAPPPILGPADPFESEDQQRKRDADARAADAAARAREADARAADAAARSAAEWNATHNPDGTAKTTVGKPTEAQAKIATLLTRIAGGFNDINSISETDPGAQSPGLVESMRGDLMPGGFGGLVTRGIAGSDRRTVHDSQRDILDALLTLGTGAAYNAEQLTGQMAAYFPQYNDTPEEIAVKNNRLVRLIEAAKANAGPAWAQVEPAIAPYMAKLAPKPQGGGGSAGGAGFGEGYFDANGNPLGPEGGLAYDKKGNFIGLTGRVTDTTPSAPTGPVKGPDSPGFWQQIGAGVGDIAQSAGDLAGIVANPLNMGINAMFGTNLSTDMGRNVRDLTGLPDNSGIYSDINRFGSAALMGGGLAKGAAGVLDGTAARIAETLGRTPIRDTFAGAGAGAGSYAGKKSGIPGGEYAGMLGGGLLGYGGASAATKLAGPRGVNATMQAADDLRIRMMPADAGGIGTRFASGVVDRTLGAIPMAEGSQSSIASARQAANRVAQNIGDYASDTTGAGQAAVRGLKDWVKSSSAREAQLFERIPIKPDTPTQLTATRNALVDLTQGFQSNPALGKIWANNPQLKATLDALVPQPEVTRDAAGNVVRTGGEIGGQLSWADMKRLRSTIGEVIGQPGLSRDGSDIAALRRLYGAITSDMEATAAQSGPRALTEWKRAVQYSRGRNDRIENVLTKVLGDSTAKSDEAAYQQINRWAQDRGGDFRSLARTMRSMPKDEADTVRATVLQRLGTASKGRQDETGEVFSPAEFVTQWNGLSKRARSVLFPDKTHRDSIDKLVKVMSSMKQAEQFSNTSKTSIGTNIAITSGIGYANPVAGVVYALGQFGAGKLLASPRFARILASTSKLPARQQSRKLTEQLGVLAKSEPMLANNIQSIQGFLREGMAQSPMRAAAQGQEEQNGGGIPPQQ